MVEENESAGQAFERLVNDFGMPRFESCTRSSTTGGWRIIRDHPTLPTTADSGHFPADQLFDKVQKWWNERVALTGKGKGNWDHPTSGGRPGTPDEIIIRILIAAEAAGAEEIE